MSATTASWLSVDGLDTSIRVRHADNFLTRARGLLGHARLTDAEGLWIRPCNSVHTFGMTYSIDVVFLDSNLRVLRIAHELRRRRIASARGARSTLELLGGVARQIGIKEGIQLQVVDR
jgi:uncharacterized membrane protein (UPF0127 family)